MFEFIVKVVSYGLLGDFGSYLRDSWSALDFIIDFFSILDMSLAGLDLSFMKIIRMLRILKPLRFISNNPSLKVLVNCMIESIPGLSNIILVILLVWYIFFYIG